MIRNKSFIKRKIGTRYVIVAVGDAVRRFNGMLSINATGSVIWELLDKETDLPTLVTALTARYDIDEESATRDAEAFLEALRRVGAIVES